jgi:hypothetical protein
MWANGRRMWEDTTFLLTGPTNGSYKRSVPLISYFGFVAVIALAMPASG